MNLQRFEILSGARKEQQKQMDQITKRLQHVNDTKDLRLSFQKRMDQRMSSANLLQSQRFAEFRSKRSNKLNKDYGA